MKPETNCPRCYDQVMRAWEELNDEEKEVVKRLPAAVDYPEVERHVKHRWCTRCWYESLAGETEA